MEFNHRLKSSFLILPILALVFLPLNRRAHSSDRQELIRQRLEVEVSELESTVEQLEEQLSEAEDRIEELEATVSEQDQTIEKLREEKQELEADRNRLQDRLDEKGTEEEVVTSEREEIETEEETGPQTSDTLPEQFLDEDIEKSGLLWLSRGRPYPVRRYPLDYELKITTNSIDSLSRLAHQYYRDAEYGVEIYRANRDRLPDQQTVPRNTRLTLPPYGQISGRPVEFSLTPDPARLMEEDFDRRGELWKTEGRTYPVRRQPLDYELFIITGRRDSLTRISHQYYGNYRHWETIYEINSERIDNPDLLPGGTELRLPPLAELE